MKGTKGKLEIDPLQNMVDLSRPKHCKKHDALSVNHHLGGKEH